MSFNPGNFISNAIKSPVQKIVDRVVGEVAAGVQSSVTSVASSFSQQLFSIGQSYDSISAISSLKVDSIVANGSRDYAGFAGKCVDRASGTSHGGSSTAGMSTKEYATSVAPQGKIGGSTYAKMEGVDVYPPDIAKYQMRFDFMTYERPTPFKEATSDVTWSLVLPMPKNMAEVNSVDWNDEKLGMIGDIADAVQRGATGVGDGAATAGVAGISQGLRSLGGQKGALGKAGTLAQQYFGIAPNPNVTVAFGGPKLRTHEFTWDFAPASPDESLHLKKIFAKLKAKSLAKATQGLTSLLGYPDMVQVTLAPEKFIEYKMAVIERVSVNYTSAGQLAFFKGTNLPVMMSLTITLQEIEMVLAEGTVEETFSAASHRLGAIVGNDTSFDMDAAQKDPNEDAT